MSPITDSVEVVRRAGVDDVSGLREALVRAFADDPVARWLCPREALRGRMHRRLYEIVLGHGLRHEEVWAADGLAGAAIWLPPDHTHHGARETLELLRAYAFARLVPRLPLIAAGALKVELAHPRKPPHWYLFVLGVDPAAQGRGLGSKLMAPVLEQCDTDGVGAYLEASKKSSIAFYARHGFRATGEVKLPRGPTVYPMWREPRG